MERLGLKVEALAKRLADAHTVDESDHASSLDARLNHLETGGCDDREFMCSRTDRECVSSLLVCDHVNDCPHGEDESDETCHNRAEAGAVFEGHVDWEACMANPNAELTITITRTKVVDYFQPRVWISASVNLEYDDENFQHIGHAENHEGFYNYGTTRLVLSPAEGDHIGAVCDFITEDLADCTITQQGTLEACAHVRVHRVSH